MSVGPGTYPALEVDAHHRASGSRAADLAVTGISEHRPATHEQLAPGELLVWLNDYRVTLDGAGSSLLGVGDRCLGQGSADAASAESHPSYETGDSPDAVIIFGLVTPRPRNAGAEQTDVLAARLDGTPTGGGISQVGHQAAGGAGFRMVAVGLFTEQLGPLLAR